VKSFHFNTKEELINHNFDLGDLTSGLYFICMKNKYGTGTKKLILQIASQGYMKGGTAYEYKTKTESTGKRLKMGK